jgi:hypothetical protein
MFGRRIRLSGNSNISDNGFANSRKRKGFNSPNLCPEFGNPGRFKRVINWFADVKPLIGKDERRIILARTESEAPASKSLDSRSRMRKVWDWVSDTRNTLFLIWTSSSTIAQYFSTVWLNDTVRNYLSSINIQNLDIHKQATTWIGYAIGVVVGLLAKLGAQAWMERKRHSGKEKIFNDELATTLRKTFKAVLVSIIASFPFVAVALACGAPYVAVIGIQLIISRHAFYFLDRYYNRNLKRLDMQKKLELANPTQS